MNVKEEWDNQWKGKVETYNRHHQKIWDYLNCLDAFKGNVVDLGCGPCVIYQDKQVSLIGVDWSVEGLYQARLHYPNGVYIEADAANTDLPTGQFDSVVAFGLLDLFDDWTPIVKEAGRLLKDGGKFFATLLDGYNKHKWKNYKHITSNWHLVVFDKNGNQLNCSL